MIAAAPGVLPGQVVVSEIHYHPVEEPVFNPDGTPFIDLTEDVHEFVELQNAGPEAVILTGWKLAGGIDYAFPAGAVIAPGGFLTVAKNPARIQAVYGLAAGSVLGPFTGKLKNSGDTVRVKNAADAVADEVTYSSSFPWTASADALGAQDRFTGLNSASFQYKGRSLQRVSVGDLSNDPANWLASPLSGPTPGGGQAVVRNVPKPVVIAQTRTQTSDGSSVIRNGQSVTVTARFSSSAGLGTVILESFVDDMDSTSEARSQVTMTNTGDGIYTATLPGRGEVTIVRYRFKADRGSGIEVVSPRPDDPQIAPVGTGGARETWHGYYVSPLRSAQTPSYDIFAGNAAMAVLAANIGASPRRVTAPTATGVPREVPYVAAGEPQWNGTQPAVFAHNGVLFDVHLRYHGSQYHRGLGNDSYKIHFPEHQPYNEVTSFFITGHGSNTAETQKIFRLLDLPASLTRTVSWHFNGGTGITRLEHGEYERNTLEEWAARQQQLNPGSVREGTGEFYKAVGNIDSMQNNFEGPYTKADQAPMRANAGWSQLQRYEWTYSLQNNAWKGHVPLRDMIEGMWIVRGDTPTPPMLAGNTARIAAVRAWFEENVDVDASLTSLAIGQWAGIWDDTGHNQFFWRRANGKWVRLPWDFDETMISFREAQSIYSNEYGVNTFRGPTWWKDTFFKCFREEFKQRLWELNNSFLDPANLTANGLPMAAVFASTRQANVNAQVALGTYTKPSRPEHSAPSPGSSIAGGTSLQTAPYSHPSARPHTHTRWEIRPASGDYEEPVVRLTTASGLTALRVPVEQLTWGQTYYWRATHYDADNHASVVSKETSFVYGIASPDAGNLVINEILAENRGAVENSGTRPDYIELRNNTGGTVALGGLTLTDDPAVPAKYTFPAGTVLTGTSHLVVWCDSAFSTPGLHSGFKLDADGQTVLLMNGSTILDAVAFGPQAPDISIGRIVNGSGGWQANTPTPGGANAAVPLGTVSALRINEWMALPAYGEDWFEIWNPGTAPVQIGNLHLSDTAATPALTKLPALSFIAPRGYAKISADGLNTGANHAAFKLSGGGDSIILTDAAGRATLHSVTFGAQAPDVPEGSVPDGGAVVAAFPGTGSPGRSNRLPTTVLINEALSNSVLPLEDAVELRNPADLPADIGGWWLSDDPSALQKYRIPAGTVIPAGGFLTIPESRFNSGTAPFSLSSLGDEVILSAVDPQGALTGYRDQVSFGPAAENVSFGRVAVAQGTEFWAQTARTPDAPNAAPQILPVIINEVMYHPADVAGADNVQDEFIELQNLSAQPVGIGGWRVKGDSDYTFPAGAVLPAGGYALITGIDPAAGEALTAFRARYGLTAAVPVFGPFTPRLSNSTQNVELARPGPATGGEVPFILADKVACGDAAPWDPAADGTGFSLQRRSRTALGNDAANWAAAVPTPGAFNSGVITELSILTDSRLAGGVAGISHSQSLTAVGGAPVYAWSVSAGALPDGLTLNGDGTLSGTPQNTGVFSFSAQVTDDAGSTTAKAFTMQVSATPLTITTGGTLPAAIKDQSYSQTLAAAGGTPPYAWFLLSGSLPPGVTLGGGGGLSGTATAYGPFSFTLQVADSGGLISGRTFQLSVPAPPLIISSAPGLPGAMRGVAYAQSLVATGGAPPYSWTLNSGALPGGVIMSSAGELSGSPSAPGAFSFTARVTDRLGTMTEKGFSLSVVPAPLVIASPSSLPPGVAGDPLDITLAASGGTPPFTWTLTAGSLPGGISLTPGGVISGTPQSPGDSAFRLRVADSAGVSLSKDFQLSVTTSGPLHHFSWDYIASPVYLSAPFAVQISARDAQDRLVSGFSGNLTVTASTRAAPPSPVVITELTDETEDQFELQNVTAAPADTTGWFVRIGDSTAAVSPVHPVAFQLPPTLAAGELLRVSEQNAAGRSYFGGSIAWNTTVSRGWIMLFDAGSNLRDFAAFGWTQQELAALSVTINARTVTPVSSGHWTGGGLAPGVRGGEVGTTTDSWRRAGTADSNTAADWSWAQNAHTFGTANPGLTLPWVTSAGVTVIPASAQMTGGRFLGRLRVLQSGVPVSFTVTDTSGRTGTSMPVSVNPAQADLDLDSMPDAWETAHGLSAVTNDAAGDADRDGMRNSAEYAAGTDPADPSSRLDISSIANTGPGLWSVSWPGVAGKLYRVRVSSTLAAWTTAISVLPASDGMQTVTIPELPGGTGFIRVDIAP